MRISIICFIVVVFIMINPAFADKKWVTYTNTNSINALAICDNYLFCATTGGIVKRNITNGIESKTLTTSDGLTSNRVFSITVDSDGVIWCGTGSGGLSQIDGTMVHTVLSPEADYYNKHGYHYHITSVTVDRNGVIWIGTSGGGILSYDGAIWHTYFATDLDEYDNMAVKSIAVDEENILWFASNGRGVMRYDGTTWETYTPENGLASLNVNVIAIDKNNVKWFGTNGGLSRFDRNNWQNFRTSAGLINNQVNAIAFDSDGVVWIGTAGGVSSYDGTTWQSYTKSDGLVYNYVTSIAVDKNDVKWFGTREPSWYETDLTGISSFDGITWETHRTKGLVHNRITSIAFEDNGTAWIGTEYGISRFDGTTWENFTTDDGLPRNKVSSILVDNNGLKWFVTSEYVTINTYASEITSFDDINWITYTDFGINDKHIVSSAADKNGSIWFGCIYDNETTGGGGVYSFNGTMWEHFTSATSGLLNDHVPSIDVDSNGVVWFGTWIGASGFDGTKWKNYGRDYGLSYHHILSLAIDPDNVIWVGRYEGHIASIADSGVTFYTFDDGLFANTFSSIEVDHEGVVWAGNEYNSGVESYDGATWRRYTIFDGLADNHIRAIEVDPHGVVWFATENGLSCFGEQQVSVETPEALPAAVSIKGIYPNPFNASTRIDFSLPESGYVHLLIFNILGQKVRELISDTLVAGVHTVVWDGRNDNGNAVSSGIYISRLTMGDVNISSKMVVLK